MAVNTLDSDTALVVIDLQHGITALPTVDSADEIVANAGRLARAFRERGLPLVLVRTDFSADRGDALDLRADAPPPRHAQRGFRRASSRARPSSERHRDHQ